MILLMAGTSEGRELAERLDEQGYRLLVTTTTEYAGSLLKTGIESLHQPLEPDDLVRLIGERQIKLLIDATHPFAVLASRNAEAAAKRTGIPYFRWERGGLCVDDLTKAEIVKVSSAEEAMRVLEPYDRILLTIGSKELPRYRPLLLHPAKKVYVRVLPLPESLQVCWDLGIPPGQIIAGQGPFSAAWNCAVIEQFQIQALLTKESGRRGGVTEKLEAAGRFQIPVVILERPGITYSQTVKTWEELAAALRKMEQR